MTEWATEFPPEFDVGSATAGHAHFDANGVTFYDTDGVTPILTFDFATGLLTIGQSDRMQAFIKDPPNPAVGWLLTLNAVVNAASVFAQQSAGGTPTLRLQAPSNAGEKTTTLDLISASVALGIAASANLQADAISLGNAVGNAVVTVNGAPLPGQLVAGPVAIAGVGPFSADTGIVSVANVPVIAGKWYEFIAQVFDLNGGTAGDRFTFRFRGNGVDLPAQTVPIPAAITAPPLFAATWQAPASGNVTLDFRGVRAAGAGTIIVNGGQFWVKQIN